jgi:ribosomal protein S18 acetylase RimI-like enzyme
VAEIRRAEPSERAAAAALLERVFVGEGYTPHERLASLHAAAHAAQDLFVAVEEGRLVGTAAVLKAGDALAKDAAGDEMEIRFLAIDPACRRTGIGRALVHACIAAARDLGAIRVVLSTLHTMRSAQRLYEQIGFERMPDRDRARPGGGAMLAYVLELGGVEHCPRSVRVAE